MKVAMLGPYPRVSGQPQGGVEAAVEILALALGRLGVEVLVFDPFTGYPNLPDGTNHAVLRLPPAGPIRAVTRTAPSNLVKAIERWRPDIVHLHLGAQWSHVNSPSVLTIHGFPHLESKLRNPGIAGLVRSIPLKRAFESGLRDASAIVAISPEAEHAAASASVPSVSIPNPIAEEFFSVERVPGADFVAIGNIMRRKNQMQAIQMFGEYVGMGGRGNLILVGAVEDTEYQKQCVQAAKPFSSRVQFLGPLPRKDIALILGTARASVSTSLRETSSIAIAESFAANCPVVCLDSGTARLQLKDVRFGSVLDRSSGVSDMALALNRVGLVPVRGEPLRESVAGQHPEEVARRTIELYQSLTVSNSTN